MRKQTRNNPQARNSVGIAIKRAQEQQAREFKEAIRKIESMEVN